MRKIMLAAVLVLVLTFGVTAKAVVQEMRSAGGEMFKLPGAAVKNSQGEYLGSIADVVAGPEGRVAFAVLSYWISDDTQRRIAVPFGALSCEERDCILISSKETLDSAPTFGSNDNLVEPRVAEDIYRYFGVQPYWTEEEREN